MQKKIPFFIFQGTVAAIFIYLSSGCTPYIRTTAAVKPDFASYEKIAILWQSNKENIYEDFFISFWMDTFPNQMIVERKELLKIIREQDLLPGRLDNTTRARIRKAFGVNALIIVSLMVKDNGRHVLPREIVDLSIKAIDTETGMILVSAVSQGNDRSINSIIVEAIRVIKERIDKRIYLSQSVRNK